MAKYRYIAVDREGAQRTGVIEAPSAEEANRKVYAMELVTVQMREEAGEAKAQGPGLLKRMRKIRSQELILFTKQLSTSIRVGIPMSECLASLESKGSLPLLREVAAAMRKAVEEGSQLSEAMAAHPHVFNAMYRSVVAAGESSGALPEVLDRLIYLTEHDAKVRADIRTAVRYPIIVMVTLAVAFAIMLGFVVPKFVTFFAKANIELPLPTKICLQLSHLFTDYGPLVLLGAVLTVIVYWIAVRTPTGGRIRDRVLLALPLIGPVLNKAAMTRFSSMLSILLSSGVMVVEAFKIVGRTVGNRAIEQDFGVLVKELEAGSGIAGALRSSKHFPPLLLSMVAVGEETGQLDDLLQKVSEHYDAELSYQMKRLSDAIGPILIVSLACVVGFFALAIYMPMWELTQMAERNF